jgi:hypothetical protein
MTVITDTMLIGAGGTGAILAPLLARLLLHHPNSAPALTVVDADTYEERNSTRQPCGPEQAGLNKAAWIQTLCAQQGLEVNATAAYADELLIARFLHRTRCALVITAVDNTATRAAVLRQFDRFDGDFVFLNPGNADAEGVPEGEAGPIQGQVMIWARIGGVEIGADPRLLYDDLANPLDSLPTVGSCQAQLPSAPQLLAANALAAAHTLTLLQNFLDGTLHPGHSISFNGRSNRTHALYA